MKLSRTFHIGAILAIVIFFTAKYVMEKVSHRVNQLSENDLTDSTSNAKWFYAISVTLIFIVFYALVSKQFNRIEDEHEEATEDQHQS